VFRIILRKITAQHLNIYRLIPSNVRNEAGEFVVTSLVDSWSLCRSRLTCEVRSDGSFAWQPNLREIYLLRIRNLRFVTLLHHLLVSILYGNLHTKFSTVRGSWEVRRNMITSILHYHQEQLPSSSTYMNDKRMHWHISLKWCGGSCQFVW